MMMRRLWRRMNAGNQALTVNFLAGVFGNLRWMMVSVANTAGAINRTDRMKERFHLLRRIMPSQNASGFSAGLDEPGGLRQLPFAFVISFFPGVGVAPGGWGIPRIHRQCESIL